MTFLDEATGTELILPVTPSSYTWRHPNHIETVRLDQMGDVNLFGGRALGSCTLTDCLFPAQLYPFCNPGAIPTPHHYIYQLERWSNLGTVVRFIVSGTPTNAAVLIESVEYGEKDGTNDIYCTIVLRQYTQPESPILALSGGGASIERDSSTGAATYRTYYVETGDTLWGIAERFYGDGSLYTKIAAASGIANPDLILPGMGLVIPERKNLPATGQLSDSTKLQQKTKTVWDAATETWTLSVEEGIT